MRRKMGWTAKGIVGFVFAPIGLLFVLIAFAMGQFGSAVWKPSDNPTVFLAAFGGIGGFFLMLGLAFLGSDIRRRALLRKAYYSGNCVEAEILRVVPQTNINTTKGSPCVVECARTDASGVVHIYRSRPLYTDVSKLLKSKTVPVYIDRDNENIGFVDIDAVLPEIRVHSL